MPIFQLLVFNILLLTVYCTSYYHSVNQSSSVYKANDVKAAGNSFQYETYKLRLNTSFEQSYDNNFFSVVCYKHNSTSVKVYGKENRKENYLSFWLNDTQLTPETGHRKFHTYQITQWKSSAEALFIFPDEELFTGSFCCKSKTETSTTIHITFRPKKDFSYTTNYGAITIVVAFFCFLIFLLCNFLRKLRVKNHIVPYNHISKYPTFSEAEAMTTCTNFETRQQEDHSLCSSTLSKADVKQFCCIDSSLEEVIDCKGGRYRNEDHDIELSVPEFYNHHFRQQTKSSVFSESMGLCENFETRQQEDRSLCSSADVIDVIDVKQFCCIDSSLEEVMFDCKGGRYRNEDHDIELSVPEFSIPAGKRITVKIAVSLFSPLQLQQGLRPVSPTVKFCVVDDPDFKFAKPVKILLPHFLSTTSSSLNDLQFVKAAHSGGAFEECNGEATFKAGSMYGTLLTHHFCHFCIASSVSSLSKSNFRLVRVTPKNPSGTWKAQYCVTYFLQTCLKFLKNFYDVQEYEVTSLKRFIFSDPQATLQIHFERRLAGGWLLTQDGGSSKLTENEVDCWRLDQDELKQMEEEELYPPRFVVKVNGHQATDQATALVRFTGAQGDLETELSLEPLSYHQTTHLPTSISLSNIPNFKQPQGTPTSQQEKPPIPKPRQSLPKLGTPPSSLVRRVADQYPPNTLSSLAQCPEPVYSAHTVHYQESSPEYKTMLSCTPQLNDIIAQDPQRTCDKMIAAGLIQSVHIREFIRHPIHTDHAKATKLVDFMADRVKTSPSDFYQFMAILKSLSWTKRIVGIVLATLAQNFDTCL